MALPRQDRADDFWRWICRGLAVVGFVYLLAARGADVPAGFYVLLIGLFFGPDVYERVGKP